jgi:hypothetical protein
MTPTSTEDNADVANEACQRPDTDTEGQQANISHTRRRCCQFDNVLSLVLHNQLYCLTNSPEEKRAALWITGETNEKLLGCEMKAICPRHTASKLRWISHLWLHHDQGKMQ